MCQARQDLGCRCDLFRLRPPGVPGPVVGGPGGYNAEGKILAGTGEIGRVDFSDNVPMRGEGCDECGWCLGEGTWLWGWEGRAGGRGDPSW